MICKHTKGFINFLFLFICHNISYADKIYEIYPNGSDIFSLEGARKDIRNKYRSINDNIVVLMNEGVYYLENPLLFDFNDGGNSRFTVTYKAKEGANPIISGGNKIRLQKSSNQNVIEARVDNPYVRNLYKNNIRLPRSHGDEVYAESIYSNDENKLYGLIFDKDKVPAFTSGCGLELSYRINWRHYYFVITDVIDNCSLSDVPDNKVLVVIKNFEHALRQSPKIGVGPTHPYFFENSFDLMDEEGEWCYLPYDKKLYLFTDDNNDEWIQHDYIIGDLEYLISVKSSSEKRINNLCFEGITFCHSCWDYPSTNSFIPHQSSTLINTTTPGMTRDLIPGAIQISDSENMIFRNCKFMHLGSNGINVNNNTDGITIENNVFRDISAAAISISDYKHASYDTKILPVKNTLIRNNLIKDIGVEFQSSCGIDALYVEDLIIANNELYDMPYTGISVGYGWNLEPKTTRNVNILRNKIIGDCKKCFDGAAIYSLSHFGGEGLKIEGNYIDETSNNYYNWVGGSIYADQGSSNVYLNNNVIETTDNRRWFYYHQAGEVEVDTTYVLASNHTKYGGIEAPSGVTDIEFIGNGDHIFDLPSENAEKIIKNAGVILSDSNECAVDKINSDETIFTLVNSNNGVMIISVQKDMEFNVKVYNILGSLISDVTSENAYIINPEFKGLHIIHVYSSNFDKKFKVML